jgi:hypothetical protein
LNKDVFFFWKPNVFSFVSTLSLVRLDWLDVRTCPCSRCVLTISVLTLIMLVKRHDILETSVIYCITPIQCTTREALLRQFVSYLFSRFLCLNRKLPRLCNCNPSINQMCCFSVIKMLWSQERRGIIQSHPSVRSSTLCLFM